MIGQQRYAVIKLLFLFAIRKDNREVYGMRTEKTDIKKTVRQPARSYGYPDEKPFNKNCHIKISYKLKQTADSAVYLFFANQPFILKGYL